MYVHVPIIIGYQRGTAFMIGQPHKSNTTQTPNETLRPTEPQGSVISILMMDSIQPPLSSNEVCRTPFLKPHARTYVYIQLHPRYITSDSYR